MRASLWLVAVAPGVCQCPWKPHLRRSHEPALDPVMGIVDPCGWLARDGVRVAWQGALCLSHPSACCTSMRMSSRALKGSRINRQSAHAARGPRAPITQGFSKHSPCHSCTRVIHEELLKVCVLGPGSGIRDDFSAFKQTSQVALLHRVIW